MSETPHLRIVFLGNNWLAWKILIWLREQGEQIVGLVLHPTEKQKFVQEILHGGGLDPRHVFDGSKLGESDALRAIGELRPEIAISVLFGYILKPGFLDLMPKGCINIHPAYQPYNRGAYTNVWSIVDQTPAGVTIHYVDEGVDTGDIIAQRRVEVEPTDTGESLYRKLEFAAIECFKETWPLIRSGKESRISQDKSAGTYHRIQDVDQIDEIDLNRNYTARELIDIIRARTFPPYPGAYFRRDGKKVYLRLQLLYENQLDRK